jgi:pimeloyl-ACP methyl ester carboxylesterase
VREHFFEARGLRLHARLRGDGPLTLLLHGWLDHAGSFDLLAPLLPGRTAALDFRGHGDSAWLGPGGFYHFIDYLADIDAAIENLAPGEPARIVGHSMGAAAALLYLAARPGRVTHLTLIDALPLAVPASEVPPRVGKYLEDLRTYSLERRRVRSVQDAAERLMRNNPSLTPEVARLLAEGGIGPLPGGELAWKWDPLLRAHSPLPVTEDLVRLFAAQVQARLFIVRGERGILPPEPELRARLPMLQFQLQTIAGTGHHVHLDAPAEVARLVIESWRQ